MLPLLLVGPSLLAMPLSPPASGKPATAAPDVMTEREMADGPGGEGQPKRTGPDPDGPSDVIIALPDAVGDGMTGMVLPPEARRYGSARRLGEIAPAAGGGPVTDIAHPADRSAPGPRQPRETEAETARLRDFLAYIVNVSARRANARPVEDAATPAAARGNRISAGGSLRDLILDIPLDGDLGGMVSRFFNSALDPNGGVTFSFAGFGRFMMMFSEDDSSLQMVDLQGPNSLNLSQPRAFAGPSAPYRAGRVAGGDRALRGQRTTLGEFLAMLRQRLVAFVTSPLTIAGVVIVGLLWLVWGLRGRTA